MNIFGRPRSVSFVAIGVLFALLICFSGSVSAEGLNGIGQQGNQVVPEPVTESANQASQTTVATTSGNTSNADAVGELFDGLGVDSEASKKANSYLSPVVVIVNLMFAIILGIALLGLFLITAFDLLYIAIPPIRGLLYQGNQGGGGMSGGFGGGGMQGGMGGGFGGGGMQQQQSGGLSSFRLISDEAVSAVQGSQGGGGGGMAGGFGGGFGGGMQQQQQPMKSVLLEYTKKRMFFLIMFGIVAILFSTTVFTDLGINIGQWVLNKLLGLNENIPA